MKAIIEKYNFDGVWHFTDRANLKSIQQYGVLSLAEIRRRNITIPEPGGNPTSHSKDTEKGLDKYVRLTFIPDHPMIYTAQEEEGRIPNPIWLKINLSILFQEDVRYALGIAYTKGISLLTAKQAKEKIDFDALFTYMDWKDSTIQARRQAAVKSEILVPDFIPIEKILDCKNG